MLRLALKLFVWVRAGGADFGVSRGYVFCIFMLVPPGHTVRFARLSDEYDARLKGRPPREPYEGTLDPVSEADQMRALGFMVVAKLATIFVPIAGLAAVVVARSS